VRCQLLIALMALQPPALAHDTGDSSAMMRNAAGSAGNTSAHAETATRYGVDEFEPALIILALYTVGLALDCSMMIDKCQAVPQKSLPEHACDTAGM
jgi:hypothetical protein